MNRAAKILAMLLVVLMAVTSAMGQRRVTPVVPQTKESTKAEGERPSTLRETFDSKGQIVLVDTVTGLEYRDTLATSGIPRMIYPTIYRLTVGVDVWDAAMRALGQHYGGGAVFGELSMHNRYFPRAEVGLGIADIKPSEMNFTFRTPLAPYFKLGAAYGMFYNSNPDYRFLVGLNYGFTAFSYSVDNVTVDDPYWGETSTFNIPSRSATAGYLELMLGARVKIAGNFSMGWNLIYHQLLHESRASEGKPMYIPGFGTRGTTFTGAILLMWDFTLNKPGPQAVIP